MEKRTIFTFSALPYRQEIPVYGYYFGSKEKNLAVVGSTRGDECQQTFVCGLLIKTLKKLEKDGALTEDTGIVVIPSASQFSMNAGKRFWPMDNTDINRMFPGYDQGETTQRLADSIFSSVKGYDYGIQLASFYIPGDFVPHVRYMDTGYQDKTDGYAFGLPYLFVRKPQPIDTTTLNFNWQVFDTNAFSIFAKTTSTIDPDAAKTAVAAILRFMRHKGMIKADTDLPVGRETVLVSSKDLQKAFAGTGGFLDTMVEVGDFVEKDSVVAKIYDPYTAECLEEIKASCSGQIFYMRHGHAVAEHEIIFAIKEISQVVTID